MTEPAAPPVTPAAPAQEPATAPAATEPPPWGADFDAAKAWSLVQNLRADKEKLTNRPALTAEQQQQLSEYQNLVEASKTDAQRLQEAAQTAQREAETARADATRYKVAATFGIGSDDFDLLGSGTEEQITARAERIAAKNAAAALAAATPPVTPPPSGRPTEALRPGATPAAPPAGNDVEARHRQFFAARYDQPQ